MTEENILLNDFNLLEINKIKKENLKEIYDNYIIQLPTLQTFDYLKNILYLLEKVNETILNDDLIKTHEFNFYLTNKIYHLLKKYYKLNYLSEEKSLLFGLISRYFYRIKYSSEKLIRPIKKCLNYICLYEKYFSYEDYLKDFPKLISIYIQNSNIINSILNCLTSNYYFELFQNNLYEKFLFIYCPTYFIEYKGLNKEEISNKFLEKCLIPSCNILSKKSSKKYLKPIKCLIDLLNDSFLNCNLKLIRYNDLILITDVLLFLFNDQTLIEERIFLLKSSIEFLITLIHKSDFILKHVKQREEIFYKLINKDKQFYLIIASLMNNQQIINLLQQNSIFNQVIYQNIHQNNSLIQRLKPLLESSNNNNQLKDKISSKKLESDFVDYSLNNNQTKIVNKPIENNSYSIQSNDTISINSTKDFNQILSKNHYKIEKIFPNSEINSNENFERSISNELIESNNNDTIDEISIILPEDTIENKENFNEILPISKLLSNNSILEMNQIENLPIPFDNPYTISMNIQQEFIENNLEESLLFQTNQIELKEEEEDSILLSNKNKNQEEIILIWFDEKLNNNFDEKKEILEFLKEINDYVLICCEREILFQYINNIKNEKILLILSGSNINDIIDEIYNKDLIDLIFIYSLNKTNYLKYINNEKYLKIQGIYSEYELLKNSINENICYLIKQLQIENLFNQNKDEEIIEFPKIILLKKLLFETDYQYEKDKNEMIEILKNYYENNLNQLKSLNEFIINYQSNNSILFYKKFDFISYFINKALRIKDYQTILMCRFFIQDLSKNIQENFQKNKQKFNENFISYQTFNFSSLQISQLKNKIGNIFSMNGFLSTIKSKDIAYQDLNKQNKNFNSILEFHLDLTKSIIEFADLDEEEILFDLGASFCLNSINYDENNKIWIIKFTSLSEESFENNIKKYINQKYFSTNSNILLGELFYSENQYEICRKYFQNLRHLFLNDDYQNLGEIYDFIGQSYENEYQYDKALQNYTQSCYYYYLIDQLENMARLTNSIGIIYLNQNDKLNATIYLEKSLEISKIYFNNEIFDKKDNCQISRLMYSFACLEENEEKKEFYLLKSLNINLNLNHKCHLNNHQQFLCQIYENLSDHFFQKNQFNQALEFILKTIEIKEKSLLLLNEKIHYLKSLMKLWKICQNFNEYIWLIYENKFFQLINSQIIELIPELNDFIENLKLNEKNPFQQDLLNDHFQEDLIEKDLSSNNINLKDIEQEAQYYFDNGEKLMTENFDKALEYFEKCLEIRQKYFHENHILIGICYQDIATTYINKSLFDLALEFYYKAIQIYEIHLKKINQNDEFNIKLLYGKCFCDIGRIFYNKKQFDKSTEYFLKTIHLMDKNLSSDKICFLSDCYEGIGLNYYKKLQYDLSIVFYGKCFHFLLTHMKSSILCDHRKEIASCLIDLSCVYIDKKEYQLALENLQKVPQILPENHKDLGNAFLFIGLSYMEEKQYENAVMNYQNAIEHFQKHLPINEQNYALCLSHLGTCYSNMQKHFYNHGIDCILKAIQVYEKDQEQNKSNIAQCYWIHAFILSKQGIYDQAIQSIQISLKFRIDEDTINLGLSYNLLGVCYYKKEQYEDALSSFILSMQNYEKHLTNLYNEIGASIYFDIGTCLLKVENYQQALEYAQRSMDIREEILPWIDLQKSESHTLLALIYSQKNIQQYHKCNQHYIQAVQIAEQILFTDQDDIENIGEIFQNIAEICFNVENFQQSKEYYEKALKFMKKDKIQNHPDIEKIQNIIQSLTNTSTINI